MSNLAANRGKQAGSFRTQMRELREDQLVQAARSLLLCQGCDQLRVEDVAAACGVAKGTCYQHFRARPDLIGAAVRSLDEALARRLLSPPLRLKPHQVFEWALLEAVDAEIVTFTQRGLQAKLNDKPLEGKAWPCCLERRQCPHGGAARSTKALRRWAADFVSRNRGNDARASLYTSLVLAVPSYYFLGEGHHSQPRPRTVRSTARQLFKRLFP